MADQYTCLTCQKAVTGTKAGNYRAHNNTEGEPCAESSGPIAPRELKAGPLPEDARADVPIQGRDYERCHVCTRDVEIDRLGRLQAHWIQGAMCVGGGEDPVSIEPKSFPESTPTSEISNGPSREPEVSTPSSSTYAQPGSPYLQPFEVPEKIRAEMTNMGKEIASRLKEIFYAYDNRKTSDNRSAQVTLGPSEIGTPCDRRLGMTLMGVPAVNPGGDGWAAFVGTCVHEGLDRVFTWADAGTGRFATEIPLKFPSAFVPKGTGDLLDRTLLLFLDHKAMGAYSLKRLKEKGPSETYRVQVHTYALGATLAGEKVRHVAIVGWPRAGASLDELWVWTEPYSPKVAKDAIARVDKLAAKVLPQKSGGLPVMQISRSLPIADKYECRFCPHHLPGDKEMSKGCPGA